MSFIISLHGCDTFRMCVLSHFFSYLCGCVLRICFMSKLLEAWNFIRRYKYAITIGVFLLIIGVLDENSLIRRISHRREIYQLNSEIERYRKQYEEDSRMLKEITSNPKELEKVARERYLMKKSNEDIYVFEEDLK